jgi:hypothetical protein
MNHYSFGPGIRLNAYIRHGTRFQEMRTNDDFRYSRDVQQQILDEAIIGDQYD